MTAPKPDTQAHHHVPVEKDGKHFCTICDQELEAVTLTMPERPAPLPNNWWTRSLVRQVIRRVVGISHDAAAGEATLRAIAVSLDQQARAMKMLMERLNKQGAALNGLANDHIELERKVHFYETTNDGLRRSYQQWRANNPKPADAGEAGANGKSLIEQPKLILSPGQMKMPPATETLDFNGGMDGSKQEG